MAQPSINAGVGRGDAAIEAEKLRAADIARRRNDLEERKLARRAAADSTTTVPDFVDSLSESSRAQYEYGREADTFRSELNVHRPISTRATFADAQAAAKAAEAADSADMAEAARESAESVRKFGQAVTVAGTVIASVAQALNTMATSRAEGAKDIGELTKTIGGAAARAGYGKEGQSRLIDRAVKGETGALSPTEYAGLVRTYGQASQGGMFGEAGRQGFEDLLAMATRGDIGFDEAQQIIAGSGGLVNVAAVTQRLGSQKQGLRTRLAASRLAGIEQNVISRRNETLPAGNQTLEDVGNVDAAASEDLLGGAGAMSPFRGFAAWLTQVLDRDEFRRKQAETASKARNWDGSIKVRNADAPPPSTTAGQ